MRSPHNELMATHDNLLHVAKRGKTVRSQQSMYLARATRQPDCCLQGGCPFKSPSRPRPEECNRLRRGCENWLIGGCANMVNIEHILPDFTVLIAGLVGLAAV